MSSGREDVSDNGPSCLPEFEKLQDMHDGGILQLWTHAPPQCVEEAPSVKKSGRCNTVESRPVAQSLIGYCGSSCEP